MEIRTPIKAIRAKCIDCCCGSAHEVRMCPVVLCPLHEYRLGHRPKTEGNDTPETQIVKNRELAHDLRGGNTNE